MNLVYVDLPEPPDLYRGASYEEFLTWSPKQKLLCVRDAFRKLRERKMLKRQPSAPGGLPYATVGRDFPRHNANAANAAAHVLPSSPFACHTVNGGGGPSLLGRRKPSRTGKPAGGGRPSQQLFWRRGLTIACVAASVASVAAGTWSYWATFHTDDNAFLGWLGMALGFGSLAIHFSDERGVA